MVQRAGSRQGDRCPDRQVPRRRHAQYADQAVLRHHGRLHQDARPTRRCRSVSFTGGADPAGCLFVLYFAAAMSDQDRNRLPAGQSRGTSIAPSTATPSRRSASTSKSSSGPASMVSRGRRSPRTRSPPEQGLGMGCYVHNTTPDDRRMGEGWEEIFVRQDWCWSAHRPRSSAEADGVDLILMCCAEMYPEGPALQGSAGPALSAHVRSRAPTGRGARQDRLALLLPTPWTSARTARPGKASRGWPDVNRISASASRQAKRSSSSSRRDRSTSPSIWGYGDGLAPFDPDTLLADISAALGCPTVTPNVLNVFQARMLRPRPGRNRYHVER